MVTKAWPEKWFTVTDDEVVILGDAAQDIIYSYNGKISVDNMTPEEAEEFADLFDILGTEFLGDPKESFYQGITFMVVIKRKSDGKLFGYPFWKPVAKHAEEYLESNGDEYGYSFPSEFIDAPGFDWDTDYVAAWVFKPVEPFTVTGYHIEKSDG
jgi:hypothetical protein